jgi:hypothetical protein
MVAEQDPVDNTLQRIGSAALMYCRGALSR